MTTDAALLESAHGHCSRHRREIEASDVCGCFYCCETFEPSEITEWIEDHWKDGVPLEPTDRWTAICPRCVIDSVIGSASGFPVHEQSFLHAMHEYWFERTVNAAN